MQLSTAKWSPLVQIKISRDDDEAEWVDDDDNCSDVSIITGWQREGAKRNKTKLLQKVMLNLN